MARLGMMHWIKDQFGLPAGPQDARVVPGQMGRVARPGDDMNCYPGPIPPAYRTHHLAALGTPLSPYSMNAAVERATDEGAERICRWHREQELLWENT